MTKTVFTWFILSTTWVVVALNWGKAGWSEKKFSQLWLHEKKATELAIKNRQLEAKLQETQHQLALLETNYSALWAQVKSSGPARSIASTPIPDESDHVQYEIYQWSPEKLLAMGEKQLHFKHYEKSAQFYNELIKRFPKHEVVTDKTLFAAGIAAYEAKRHDWAIKHLASLTERYPQSSFYRGAKLWMAMSEYNSGNHRKFISTVEEFRTKYRNTDEWKILSKYYEDINLKHQK
jgi:outer membrane protein assembly factor BamD (BamD/ComL family)